MRKMYLLLIPVVLYALASGPVKVPSPAAGDWGSCSFDCSPCMSNLDCQLNDAGTCLSECP